MKTYTGFLSVLVILFGVSSLFLTMYVDFFADHMFLIVAISYIVALFLALVSEKGMWKKTAFVLLLIIALLVIGFYVVMALLWNQP
ncbi:hypothetical protein [Bacillus testis]|uniref:hypothetical protein n=1 Tax=Bacillus testis TaxID=1622072 RepID=UPI00067E6E3D|nr:hypothetical protein [Bacillus testis]